MPRQVRVDALESSAKAFSLEKANAHFVGVMLDQGQVAERAWDAGRHLVKKHFRGRQGFWRAINSAHPQTVRRICTHGYHGHSYAVNYQTNIFSQWLRAAAKRMVDNYGGDPREIWAVKPNQVGLIYDRMLEFDGIGDALAKMNQFSLVRYYGVAGGNKNQHLMSIKPDILVRRVLSRMGITTSEGIQNTINEVAALHLQTPADFDAALWNVGRKYCFKTNPNCNKCPMAKVCEYKRTIWVI